MWRSVPQRPTRFTRMSTSPAPIFGAGISLSVSPGAADSLTMARMGCRSAREDGKGMVDRERREFSLDFPRESTQGGIEIVGRALARRGTGIFVLNGRLVSSWVIGIWAWQFGGSIGLLESVLECVGLHPPRIRPTEGPPVDARPPLGEVLARREQSPREHPLPAPRSIGQSDPHGGCAF